MSDVSGISTPASQAEIKLFSAFAIRPAILNLVARFEKETGIRVNPVFDLNPLIKKRIDAGKLFDMVAMNADVLDDLVKQGKVTPHGRRPFGRVGLGVAIRAGSPRPDVSTVEGLRRTLQNAASIADTSEGSSGAILTAVLAQLGIWDEVQLKLKSVGGGETGHVVARGDTELGIVPVTTILVAAPGAELAGMFPAELQSYIDFDIGLSTSASHARHCLALADFLMRAEEDDMLRSKGVERRV
jgi:molybdate transport system substrate-binding protein